MTCKLESNTLDFAVQATTQMAMIESACSAIAQELGNYTHG